MQPEEYNRRGKELVDYITQYLSSIRERRVIPDVKPGYMRDLVPDSAPVEPEEWDNIFNDIEKVIMPGVVHWQSPYMHAYFPALTSWPSLLGDMLADAINCLGFTWASSPASTELEMNVMDWLCKALGLPSFFLHHHPDSKGGGVLQSTLSESTLVALLAARKHQLLQLRAELDQDVDDSILNSRLVAYASDQAHSSVEKAGLVSLVKIRFLPSDDQQSLRGDTLRLAIEEDRRIGLVPFMVCATLGTTGVCAFDKLSEIGPICAAEGVWLHVDAAYAGAAYLCSELRWSLDGINFADSFGFNPSKWMMVHFDCTAFWVKDKFKLQQTFNVDPVYLRHENSQVATDFMHWQIPLSRRFRSLKLWFVMRSFGLKNLQAHIRHGIEMAKLLESQIRKDPNFEIPAQRHLGLVVFCLKRGNAATQELLTRLTRSGSLYLIPAEIHSKRIIRFTVTSQFTTADDILRDWGIISKMATALLSEPQYRSRDDDEGQHLSDGSESEAQEDDVLTALDSSHIELWIDKAWTRTARPMRSLSCSSEPLPYIYNFGFKPPCKKDSALTTPVAATSTGPMRTIAVTPSNAQETTETEKQVKKLTKFNSVPSFCYPWAQCGRHPLCCPLKANQGNQHHSSCQVINCVGSPVPTNNTAPPNAPKENGTNTAALKGK
ncbi:histidine decarboxylase [Eucyclogobius newberryi]|uniref:histidine decarboxylase n=1 Tax=Eucyclogobius newberryi TaxID=166745 RepID=UPI003B5CB4D8